MNKTSETLRRLSRVFLCLSVLISLNTSILRAQDKSFYLGFGPQVNSLKGETNIANGLSISSNSRYSNMVPQFTIGYVQELNDKLSFQVDGHIAPSRYYWTISSEAGTGSINKANTFASSNSLAISISPKAKFFLPIPQDFPIRFSLMGGVRVDILPNNSLFISESDESVNVPALSDVAHALDNSTREVLPSLVGGGNIEWKNLTLQIEHSVGFRSITSDLDINLAAGPNKHYASFINLRLGYTFWFL
jgi:hypothetical protein